MEIEAWWELKNLHFRPWSNKVSLRCLNNSDLLIAHVMVKQVCAPLKTAEVRIKFWLPEELAPVKDELMVHLSLFDEEEGVYFGDDLCIRLSF
jgi:hypothetical protein